MTPADYKLDETVGASEDNKLRRAGRITQNRVILEGVLVA